MRSFIPILALLAPLSAWPQTGTVSGEFVVERPTLVSLGFEWKISGDDNRNARVEVSYRKAGQPEWRKALPLLLKGAEGHAAARTCFACHNQGIPMLAFTTARERGFAVRDEDMKKQTEHIAAFLDRNQPV